MTRYSTIDVHPVSRALGAEIAGADLSATLTARQADEIRQALLEHLVIFFRDQSLTPAELLNFARRFGEPIKYPFVAPLEDQPLIVPIVKQPHEKLNFGGLWHSDTTYLPEPPMGTMLFAREVPPVGGDTLFANMHLAYESLSHGMQNLLQELIGVNRADKLDPTRTSVQRPPRTADSTTLAAEHPVVREHPETGRKALYVNFAHTTHFRDMTEEESAPLLNFLFEHQTKPEFCCRFRWTTGALAFWDNRCTLHYPVNDYHGYRREMHRITLGGDRPR